MMEPGDVLEIYSEVSPSNETAQFVRRSLGLEEDGYVSAALSIIKSVGTEPWTTQRHLAEKTNLSREELKRVNFGIRSSADLQKLIAAGPGRKYAETLNPLLASGAMDDVLDGRPRFPLRLGLYPGLDCPYHCSFCGRNENVKYAKGTEVEGNPRFARLFDSMPEDSTISISGGLEPLTNPGLGEIVRAAKSKGIRVPLITNAHLLTPKVLAAQPGLGELDSLRVSLYGVDEESYSRTTGNKVSFQTVTRNVTNYLRLKAQHGWKTNLGFNYIVVPENIENLPKVIQYIAGLNRAAEVEGRSAVNFLTLREDFGSVTGRGDYDSKHQQRVSGFIEGSDRERLRKNLILSDQLRRELCPDLKIDLGYAMAPLVDGLDAGPVLKIDGEKMHLGAYPQVSLAIDSLGDVFLYREAGFYLRPGNEDFIIGRIDRDGSLEDIISNHLQRPPKRAPRSEDARFLDAFDHNVEVGLARLKADRSFGFGTYDSPVLISKSQGRANFGSPHQ
jgi:dTDP-4-amino-4,6-dideoxy-D-glucose ammonia-lyase